MHSLSLRDRIAQMVVMPCYAEKLSLRSRAYRDYRRQIHVVHIGGLIILGRVARGAVQPADPKTVAGFLNQMQGMAAIPLLVGADFERGLSNRVSHSAPWPHNMAFGAARDIEDVRYQAAVTAKEARAVGVQWIFAPDADVNSNPDNPIINIRSYGENPEEVSRFVRAYVEGAHSDSANPVLVTVKHFPGQGNTSVDSHLGLARNSDSREQLEQIDLPPFREGIAAGVDAVMAAHMAVPAMETEEIPATVSRVMLTGLLRDEMKFQGLVVTDAMDMQGLTKLFDPSEAAVRAVEAGADVLLMPRNAEETVNAVLKAVQSGRISRTRIDESVTRILSAKARVGLQHTRHVNLARLDRIMDSTESEARAQSVAARAITLVKNERALVPLAAPESACLTVLAESDSGSEGPHLIDEFKKRVPAMKTQLLDPGMPAQALDDALNALAGCAVNVAAVYSTRFDNTGAAWLRGDFPGFLTKMLAGKTPVIVLGIGIPYFARAFSGIGTYITTLSSAESSETAVVRALFGEIGMSGKLPVTIPGFAAAGTGIDVPAKGK
jgi:beta-N-acetylhexosaminidase